MYTIGQIFESKYPPEAALWCKKNRAYIKEIEAVTRQQERRELVKEERFIDEVLDAEGNVIKPFEVIPAEYKTVEVDVKVRRFEIVAIPEPTEKELAQRRIAELEAYLTRTDWYAVRYAETGVPVPEAVKTARATAREEISTLREAIE